MALNVTSQTLEVEGLSSTVVTAVVLDTNSGLYVREYRFYGAADAVGGTGPVLLIVRAKASDPDPLTFQTGSITL